MDSKHATQTPLSQQACLYFPAKFQCWRRLQYHQFRSIPHVWDISVVWWKSQNGQRFQRFNIPASPASFGPCNTLKKKHVDFLCRLQNPGLRVVSSTIQAKSKPEIIEIWPIFPHHHMPQLSHTLSAHIANETTSYPSSILNHPKCGISSGWISDPSKSNLQDLFLHYVSKQPVELGSSNTRWRLRFVPAMQALVSPRRWWRSSIPLVTQKATTMGSDDTTVSHAEMENARVTQELAHIVILIKKHSAQLEKFIPYLPLFHTEWLLPCDVDTLTKLDKMH